MKPSAHFTAVVCLFGASYLPVIATAQATSSSEEVDRLEDVVGQYGGRLVVGERAEPKTLNPVTATDSVSREVIGRINADLIEINRASQQTESALAKSWTISKEDRKSTRLNSSH